MPSDNLQLQRLELKYIIPEETARAVRDFVSCHLQIDEFGAGQPNLSYPVHSLYLDSDTLTTYWNTVNGNKNRYKLRLRFYDNKPGAPVYFEIKRRMNEAILKQRGGVRREFVDRLLAGHFPEREHLVSPDSPSHLVALQRFCQLMQHIQAKPKAHIAYAREAWISPHNNAVRVTLDRNVQCDPEPTAMLKTETVNPTVVFGNKVILELKFTGRFPEWFRELVRVFNLVQCSAAKYADGVVLRGEHHFLSSRPATEGDPEALEKLKMRRDFLVRTGGGLLNVAFA